MLQAFSVCGSDRAAVLGGRPKAFLLALLLVDFVLGQQKKLRTFLMVTEMDGGLLLVAYRFCW